MNFRKTKDDQGAVFLDTFEWGKKTGDYEVLGFSPIYEGCRVPKKRNLKTSKKSKVCMQTKLRNHIAENFNTKILKGKRIYSNKTLRTNVGFVVNKEGIVGKIKPLALTQELENEASRILKMVPKMMPREMEGKKVNVLYNLPIIVRQ